MDASFQPRAPFDRLAVHVIRHRLAALDDDAAAWTRGPGGHAVNRSGDEPRDTAQRTHARPLLDNDRIEHPIVHPRAPRDEHTVPELGAVGHTINSARTCRGSPSTVIV